MLQAAQWGAAGAPNEPDRGPAFRLGFTASRKVGGAVERNRARRRLRALARDVMSEHAEAGRDYVLIARRNILTRAYGDLVADLEKALRGLDAYRDDRRPDANAGPSR